MLKLDGLDDAAVLQVDAAIGAAADALVVRDHQDGAALGVEVGEEIEHDLLVGGVEVAGGLVGEDDLGIVGEGAGNGDALLFAAGKLAGQVMGAIAQAYAVERAAGLGLVGHAVKVLREHDVFDAR